MRSTTAKRLSACRRARIQAGGVVTFRLGGCTWRDAEQYLPIEDALARTDTRSFKERFIDAVGRLVEQGA